MRVAITVWDGQVAPVFDAAGRLLVLEVEGHRVTSRRVVALSACAARQRASRLARLHVNTLVCGAISAPVEQLVIALGIRVIPFVTGPVDEVIRLLERGDPVPGSLRMPGYPVARAR